MLTIPKVFDFSDGVATSLEAGLPPGVDPSSEMEEHDSNSDYDAPGQDPIEGESFETKPSIDTAAPLLPERTVKAYIIKYTAYRTFVGDSRSPRCPLMGEIQPARDHLVYLFRRDYLLPQRYSRFPRRLCQVYLSVRR